MGSLTFRIKFLTLALLATFCFQSVQGQVYSEEPVAYLKEITDLFVGADKKEGKRFIEEQFTPFWGSGLSDVQRQDIYDLSNSFGKLRFRAYPEFFDFFSVAVAIQADTPENYTAWVSSLKGLAKTKKQKLTDYNETVARLYNDGTLVLKNTVQWKAIADSFTLVDGKSPSIFFDNLDLICIAKGDSSVIHNTSGSFNVLSDAWKGQGGKVDWKRTGLDPTSTFATLFEYDVSMKSTDYKVDSVLFHNEFFDAPLLGTLKENIIAGKDIENSSFPKFDSYEKRLLIKQIAEGMDYDGGFSMKGRRLLGSGTPESPARITIYRDDRPFIIVESLNFTIRPDKISSETAKLAIYMSEDSITHPGLQFKFVKADRLVTLVRTDEGISKSPFYNSYHDLEMYFEALYWNMADPLMTMGNLFGSSNTRAAFESTDYYREKRYYALQGIDPINPLIRVRDLVKKFGPDFYLEDYTNATRLPSDLAKKQLIIMANQGFLEYDLNSDHVIVRDKLENYVSNRAGKRDYDILLFNSNIATGANASLSLINFDLILKGVGKINLSDSNRVAIYPDGKELIVKKDRDFLFSGVTVAGNVEIFGSDCRFDYTDFKVDIATIDSVRLNVAEFGFSGVGRAPLLQVKNVMEGGKGVLTIDHHRNKSGLKQKEVPHFPSFESLENSFVYYDGRGIQGGAYDREEFFYKVEPYVLDSLDNFVANNVSLDGTLISGIFPNIVHPITVQEDYSLGFETTTPTDGLLAYKGKNRFNERIVLNYNGLQGDGTINYLTATAIGKQFIFLPDSTIGTTTSFVNREQASGTRVPEANAEVVRISFIPDEDILNVRTIDEEISCFNGDATIEGSFDLRPTGLEGQGVMTMSGAELESNKFTYTEYEILADTSNFRLTGLGTDFAFKTEEVSAHIDFKNRKGEFKSNGDASFVEFPANQYVCYMDKFVWFMDQNDLALEYDGQVSNDFVIDTDLDLNRSNFFSTREDQDSLNFMSPKAIYDIDESIIRCGEIEYIKVADARISPDSGVVIIRRKARMDPLEDAVIVASFINQFHTLRNADIEINSSIDYEGAGDYTYIDENKSEQIITFRNIRVDSTQQTIASGTVLPNAEFALSPAFQYSGEVSLEANKKGLSFDGRTRIFHACDLEQNWMNFSAEIDPDAVAIPVDSNLTDEIGLPVGIGVMMNIDELDLYSTFLSAIETEIDQEILTSNGILVYDKKTKEYLVGSEDKIRENNLTGSLVALSTETCQVRGEGRFDFGIDLGQVDINPVGKFLNNTSTSASTFIFDAMFPLDFHFSEQALKMMGEDLATYPELKPVVVQNSLYQMGIKEILGLEKADKLISELTLSGTIKKLPTELSSTIVFTDVHLQWDSEDAIYKSSGKIGIASIGKQEVFAEVDGIITLTKKRGGDAMMVYLELDKETWYYFEYTRTLMQAFSSNLAFNETLMGEKEDDRKSKAKKGEDPYTYMLSSRRKVDIALEDIGYK